jgi:very-short-patch-repair endonuclease
MPKIPTNTDFDVKLKLIHGDKFTRVEDRKPNQKNILCLCNVCGKEWNPRISHLLKGFGCPNCRKTSPEEFDKKCLDIFGNSFIRVSDYPSNQNEKVTMYCKICNCKETHKVSHILSGHGCKKCGHTKTIDSQRLTLDDIIKKSKEINGDRYDFSLVANEIKLNIRTKIPIICNTHGVFFQSVSSHIHGKCGCPKCKESKGEKRIRLFLEKNNINYTKNKRFDDCRDKKPLPFDFFIVDKNILIEYDGEQHTNKIRFGFGKYMTDELKQEYLNLIQRRDKIKDEYCLKNNIRLLRISYKDYNEIETILSFLLNHIISNSNFK